MKNHRTQAPKKQSLAQKVTAPACEGCRQRDVEKARLELRVAELEAAAAANIRNSSKPPSSDRSEERRVGKECRSRGSPDHLKKKNPATSVRPPGLRERPHPGTRSPRPGAPRRP